MINTMVAVIALAVLGGPAGASASVIFNWIGTCDGIITPGHGGGPNGCSGQATLRVVTTDAYVPGEVFFAGPPPPVLLQALYVDENITFDFAPFFVPGDDSFQLPASPSEGGFVQLEQIELLSNANGVWRFSGENLRPGCTGIDRCS